MSLAGVTPQKGNQSHDNCAIVTQPHQCSQLCKFGKVSVAMPTGLCVPAQLLVFEKNGAQCCSKTLLSQPSLIRLT